VSDAIVNRVDFCDDLGDAGFGWIRDEKLGRCSHALADGGGVWLVDPLDGDGIEERVLELGRPRGVIQLLDRHARDCARLAARLGIPHHVVPFGRLAGAAFEFLRIADSRFWREAALWWPSRRVLVAGDAIGTVHYFVAPGERLGVHPFLRIRPPRMLASLDPQHVLCGHGEGVHGDGATDALRVALATARRRLPRALIAGLRGWT
jgi:hypothetical protein